MIISIDGNFSGPHGELDWHHVDDEFNQFAIDQLHQIDTILFGRVTYQMMASYWPTASTTDDPIVAGLMNNIPKIVFSRSLEKAEWSNTRLVKDHLEDEILTLKRSSGKDIAIFGSSTLCVSLIKLGLIDEFRLMVNPIVLGEGRRLFEGLGMSLELTLVDTKRFQNGNQLLFYTPSR